METKFNFNSQICTSVVQSERLLALGLKKETADMCYKVATHDFRGNEINEKDRYYALCCWYDESSQVCGLERKKTIPAWSLHRLIEMTASKWQEYMVLLPDAYDEIISDIEIEIGRGSFNKEFLV